MLHLFPLNYDLLNWLLGILFPLQSSASKWTSQPLRKHAKEYHRKYLSIIFFLVLILSNNEITTWLQPTKKNIEISLIIIWFVIAITTTWWIRLFTFTAIPKKGQTNQFPTTSGSVMFWVLCTHPTTYAKNRVGIREWQPLNSIKEEKSKSIPNCAKSSGPEWKLHALGWFWEE